MRRVTFTPGARRPTISTPTRQSIAPGEEGRRRDIRKIRDANYKQQCVDVVYNFLLENGYDQPFTPKTLHSPSAKDFQLVFKFVYSFVENFDYSAKFEDDFLLILKNVKYPFANEITRSQLIAITPHTWPIILSMLAWMVNLAYKNTHDDTEDMETFFYDFVCEGYLKFMEGNEDDTQIESEFERKVAALHKERFREIESLRAKLEDIDLKIKSAQGNFGEVEEMRNKKKEILSDIDGVVVQKAQMDEKIKKYALNIERTKSEVGALEEQIGNLKSEQKALQTQIEDQKINPEDIKIMNAEKIELYKELERVKPEKENLFRALSKLEQELWTKVEEFEKLSFDFQTLVKSAEIRVIKDQIVEDVEIEGDLEKAQRSLDDAIAAKRDEVLYLNELKNKLEERRSESGSVLGDFEEKVKYMNDKLFRTGKLYIEKKEISEIEQRKSQKEMERIENELLKLNLESNGTLLLSEQNLQRAKIMLDRTVSGINYEREGVVKIVSGFCQKMENQHKSALAHEKELRRMIDEQG